MKIIQIKASQFFELLKTKDTSMWEIFAQMIDGEEKLGNDDDPVEVALLVPLSLLHFTIQHMVVRRVDVVIL